jgi:hypothetical protein
MMDFAPLEKHCTTAVWNSCTEAANRSPVIILLGKYTLARPILSHMTIEKLIETLDFFTDLAKLLRNIIIALPPDA